MENKLIRYYRSALSKGVWIITFFGVYLALIAEILVDKLGEDSIWVDLIRSGLSMCVIATLFLLFEKQVRTRLWKLAHPELDISGIWKGETTYQVQEINKKGCHSDDYKPEISSHEIRFSQDCLNLKVEPTVAENYPGAWFSLVAGFGKDQIRYAYQVNYGNTPNRPDSAVGYEELNIIETDAGQRPIKLAGTFSHCAGGQRPVYSGTVSFHRDVSTEKPTKKSIRLLNKCTKVVALLLKPRVE